MDLHLRNIGKRFTGTAAVDGFDLDIASGELVALLGPSGSGKTTLLRIVAGLLHPDRGQVMFGDVDATRLSLRERNVGFVFQHYALFRHMTVAENIAFGLRSRPRSRRPGRAVIAHRVEELLALIQLSEFGGRYPEQLSGGQKQRVALARALAIDPRVLLLDEPFGALDAKVRIELRRWLRLLHERTGQTTLFVTHDQEEALELADRVVLMRNGKIEQVDTSAQTYLNPVTEFAYGFIGRSCMLTGQVANGKFRIEGGSFGVPVDVLDGPARLYFRPQDMRVSDAGSGFPAWIRSTRFVAGECWAEAEMSGTRHFLEFLVGDGKQLDQSAQVGLIPARFKVFPAS